MEISVIIVSYNTKELLKNCLTSIIKHTKNIRYEIIVVDNNSQDESLDLLKKHFPQVQLIKNSQNIGFGRANNLGAQKAKGDYLLFLNSDTYFEQNSLKTLLEEAKKISNLGALAPQIKNEDKTIQQSVGFFPDIPQIIYWMSFLDDLPFGSNLKPYHVDHDEYYKKNRVIDWATAAVILIPRKVFNKINGFDKNIFMYGEDVEICYRIKKKGYSINFTPNSNVIHIGRGSHKKVPRAAFIGEYIGIIYFYKKYRSFIALQIVKIFLKIGALLRIILFTAIGRRELAKYYVEVFKVG